MKHYIVLFSCVLLSFYSCKKELPAKVEETTKPKVVINEPIINDSVKPFAKDDYDLIFEYSEEDSNQWLGVSILDKKTIKFHLITETLPCDTYYQGIAINNNWDQDPEIDSDEKGGYFVDEYFMEKKEYQLGIRIADDLSKVIIKYHSKEDLDTDCLPIDHKIMRRVN
ncbi:hypothetical protein [Flavobacterium capsici]|uniref:Uncharacterized protein n=1 Tax=Flavobacterium capsici TaxID=3075618 RepID=A0AA96EZ79_9FLAO|nr:MULTISPECIES: hypothetical protein [unclassified Flavobacterium]WNM18341.1 hypothetical protein RN608_09975 [Flavobacterium sp. PMR2A8]WNM22392.1 hypothetical protein RN605_03275 [Flavobacterium sp. PMTSA4]